MSGFGTKRGAVDETRPSEYVPVRKKGSSGIIVSVVILLFSLVFLGVAIWTGCGRKAKAKKCTEKVEAVVIENRPVKSETNKAEDDRGYTYQPIFQYEYGGRKYITGGDSSSRPAVFSEGEEVEIYVDPDDPTKIYVPSDKTSKTVAILFASIGGAAVLISLLTLAVSIRNRNRPDEEIVDVKYYE